MKAKILILLLIFPALFMVAIPGLLAEDSGGSSVEKWSKLSDKQKDTLRNRYKVWESLPDDKKAKLKKRNKKTMTAPERQSEAL